MTEMTRTPTIAKIRTSATAGLSLPGFIADFAPRCTLPRFVAKILKSEFVCGGRSKSHLRELSCNETVPFVNVIFAVLSWGSIAFTIRAFTSLLKSFTDIFGSRHLVSSLAKFAESWFPAIARWVEKRINCGMNWPLVTKPNCKLAKAGVSEKSPQLTRSFGEVAVTIAVAVAIIWFSGAFLISLATISECKRIASHPSFPAKSAATKISIITPKIIILNGRLCAFGVAAISNQWPRNTTKPPTVASSINAETHQNDEYDSSFILFFLTLIICSSSLIGYAVWILIQIDKVPDPAQRLSERHSTIPRPSKHGL